MVDSLPNADPGTTTAPTPTEEAQPAPKARKGFVMVRSLVGGNGVSLGDGRRLKAGEFAEVSGEVAATLKASGQVEVE